MVSETEKLMKETHKTWDWKRPDKDCKVNWKEELKYMDLVVFLLLIFCMLYIIVSKLFGQY